jgi:UDP-N-acetylmuramoyl-tripeptide--D-alanyl-D-alanine ligase
MGVSLAVNTLLKDEPHLDYFVVEMGAYVPGEIARICALTRPQIALVTAVGPQHLERFGTLEATVEAKSEILQAAAAGWHGHPQRRRRAGARHGVQGGDGGCDPG